MFFQGNWFPSSTLGSVQQQPIRNVIPNFSLSNVPDTQFPDHFNTNQENITQPETRKDSSFIGLTNYNVSCYSNSLFQAYFMLPVFRRWVLNSTTLKTTILSKQSEVLDSILTDKTNEKKEKDKEKDKDKEKEIDSEKETGPKDKNKIEKENKNFYPDNIPEKKLKLMKELRYLFSSLLISKKSFVDATQVGATVLEFAGKKMLPGMEQDLDEFNTKFLEMLDLKPETAKDEQESEKEKKKKKYKDKDTNNHKKVDLKMAEFEKKNCQKSFVEQMFFGIMNISHFRADGKGNQNPKPKPQSFFGIKLPIEKEDFYGCMESYCNSKCQKKFDGSKEMVDAIQQYRIERIPPILVFMLGRVVYDKTNFKAQKINKKFTFDKEIYMDKYLVKNVDLLKKKKQIESDLNKKLAQFQNELDDLQNWNKTNNSITRYIDVAINYLSENSQSENEIQQLLTQEKESLNQQINNLKSKIHKIKFQIEHLYDDLKQVKYRIHSIIIHFGDPNRGHYYSYTFDEKNQRWLNFNDRKVTEIDEEIVFKKSYGDSKESVNAYCLIYVDSKFYSETHEDISSHINLIPKTFKTLIKKDNEEFCKSKMKTKLKKFGNELNQRFQNAKNQMKKLYPSTPIRLYSKKDYFLMNGNYSYAKYLIANQLYSQQYKNVDLNCKNPSMLNEQIRKQCLNDQLFQNNQIDKYELEYSNYLNKLRILGSGLKNFHKNNNVNALKIFTYLTDMIDLDMTKKQNNCINNNNNNKNENIVKNQIMQNLFEKVLLYLKVAIEKIFKQTTSLINTKNKSFDLQNSIEELKKHLKNNLLACKIAILIYQIEEKNHWIDQMIGNIEHPTIEKMLKEWKKTIPLTKKYKESHKISLQIEEILSRKVLITKEEIPLPSVTTIYIFLNLEKDLKKYLDKVKLSNRKEIMRIQHYDSIN
ncbi:ubiquitin carboxyl-terminal hydrolase 28 [Anaeramoeba flamelloides]|uniref:Ubiquitin carboxyl-terminal hydrolase 28 n=1 Tax=Anaeramoeba flamelloides TaxID=1746091 RepID=A0ABQ8YIC6_9EUKA|nr:ubiquitin carboxyl-terminal hydrolase 28 [Anaeramoeba flamelloides]